MWVPPTRGSSWFGEKAIFYDLLTVHIKFGALTMRQALEIHRHVLQLLADWAQICCLCQTVSPFSASVYLPWNVGDTNSAYFIEMWRLIKTVHEDSIHEVTLSLKTFVFQNQCMSVCLSAELNIWGHEIKCCSVLPVHKSIGGANTFTSIWIMKKSNTFWTCKWHDLKFQYSPL